MLPSLPLENMVNTSSQLEISKHPHLSHLASLTLLAVYLAQNMLKTPYKKP